MTVETTERPGPVGPPRSRAARAGDYLVALRATRLRGLSTTGTVTALLGLLASLSPSLLPRPWPIQGVISGIVLTAFYPVGVLIGWLLQKLARWARFRYSVRARVRHAITIGWMVGVVVVYISAQIISLRWQRDSARLVGAPAPDRGYVIGSLLVTTLVFGSLLLTYRGIHWMVARVDQIGRRVLPAALSHIAATLIVVVLVGVLVDRLLLANILQVAERTSLASNARAPDGVRRPTSPLRSGGPGSSESWESLGSAGAQFVADGPTAAEISRATGAPAVEPIRVYAGIRDRSLQQAVTAVVGELDRTGAFSRPAILLYTTTGTGWVNEWHASAFEYLGGGDTAIAAMQYSTFPSALALLTDTETPRTAGRLLYQAVRNRIDALPEQNRPRLYVGGESLGAYGGNAAFGSPTDLLAGVDGAVWSGTPAFTPLHKTLTADRTPGSTEVNPVVDNGRHFRFAADQAELSADQYGRPLGDWQAPRVVYLQHPSDPVVWWSMDLMFRTPDWVNEPGGRDVTGKLGWMPIATLLQVSADMTVATDVSVGHGHVYQDELVPAWAGVLGRDPKTDYSSIVAAIRAGTRG
ncbi:alpha/beta-hydrolase family protein [Cumulibacter manganitolerans]|uniref:alpha/beta-hydrolase family protein n=1 Tax=Cumulibacter manganitolerans TaxID=1884992 RepID=UPI001296550B|nr:alpha/beta-hydrolase family protein [Cumulibacter manganitolerans]